MLTRREKLDRVLIEMRRLPNLVREYNDLSYEYSKEYGGYYSYYWLNKFNYQKNVELLYYGYSKTEILNIYNFRDIESAISYLDNEIEILFDLLYSNLSV